MFKSTILADSQHPTEDSRLTTVEMTYPRCVHAEFMTHRQFSRNAASSRAIPVEKMMAEVKDNPFTPIIWGTNQPGMQAGVEHSNPEVCEHEWLLTRDHALTHANALNNLGLHKQIVNRILEPWMWITVIVTGVDHAWENFFKLRCHEHAEPHIAKIAYMVREQYDAATPKLLSNICMHLPLTGFEGDNMLNNADLIKLSVARCARVSYLTHDGKRDEEADYKLYDRLVEGGHWSPLEHVAAPTEFYQSGDSNFGPYWLQHRKSHKSEYCRKAPRD